MKNSMKKFLALFVCVCMLMSGTAYAQESGTGENDGNGSTGSVVINETNFPDKNFREYVGEFDTDKNRVLSESEIDAVTQIEVEGKNISDLTGVEHFTSLISLICCENRLTSLDVSANTALTELDCSGNQLTALDVGSNVRLVRLICYNNQLTELNVNNNVDLSELDCSRNKLDTLDVQNNTKLEILFCSDNQLKKLDVSNHKDLCRLDCGRNGLIAVLNVKSNTKLETLRCGYNQLKELDVSANTALTELDCGGNQLSELKVGANTALTELICWENKLTDLDVISNTRLENLYCGGNQLEELDVSKNVNLVILECGINKLTSLDVKNCTKLKHLDVIPLTKADVQYTKEPDEFYYGDGIHSDDPEPVIDVSINTNSAEVNPGTSRVDSGAIRKAFGIGETDDVEVIVEQKTADPANQKRIKDHAGKFGDKVLKVYEVVMELYKDGQYNAEITDNFGRLTLSFYAGTEYAGKTAVVYQLHENADGTSEVIPYKDLTIDNNGVVTITVSKLSTFAVALQGSGANNAPATGDSANMTVWVALMMLTMTIIPIVAILGRRQKR